MSITMTQIALNEPVPVIIRLKNFVSVNYHFRMFKHELLFLLMELLPVSWSILSSEVIENLCVSFTLCSPRAPSQGGT